MKKVMFLIYSLGGGGAERVLTDTVNYLDKEKYDVTLCALFHDETWANFLGDDVHYKPALRIQNRILKKIISGGIQYLLPPSFVYRHLFQGDYDVEVAFMEAFPTKILGASCNKKAKKYTWVHIDMNTYTKQDRIYKSLEDQKRCYEKFDGIYCVSQSVKEAFEKKFGIKDRVYVSYNILNEKWIQKKAEEECAKIKKDKFTMISVGSLIPRKGFERLIRICSQLKAEGFLFELYILGDGELRDDLYRMIKEKNVADCVFMEGFQSNPYSYMKRSDLYVCSSYVEGFSTVVSEAVILGIPVVTTESSGMREILGDSEYGLITENSDESLYQGMKKMIADHDAYEHYSKKVKERSSFFSIKERLREYETILDQ